MYACMPLQMARHKHSSLHKHKPLRRSRLPREQATRVTACLEAPRYALCRAALVPLAYHAHCTRTLRGGWRRICLQSLCAARIVSPLRYRLTHIAGCHHRRIAGASDFSALRARLCVKRAARLWRICRNIKPLLCIFRRHRRVLRLCKYLAYALAAHRCAVNARKCRTPARAYKRGKSSLSRAAQQIARAQGARAPRAPLLRMAPPRKQAAYTHLPLRTGTAKARLACLPPAETPRSARHCGIENRRGLSRARRAPRLRRRAGLQLASALRQRRVTRRAVALAAPYRRALTLARKWHGA